MNATPERAPSSRRIFGRQFALHRQAVGAFEFLDRLTRRAAVNAVLMQGVAELGQGPLREDHRLVLGVVALGGLLGQRRRRRRSCAAPRSLAIERSDRRSFPSAWPFRLARALASALPSWRRLAARAADGTGARLALPRGVDRRHFQRDGRGRTPALLHEQRIERHADGDEAGEASEQHGAKVPFLAENAPQKRSALGRGGFRPAFCIAGALVARGKVDVGHGESFTQFSSPYLGLARCPRLEPRRGGARWFRSLSSSRLDRSFGRRAASAP